MARPPLLCKEGNRFLFNIRSTCSGICDSCRSSYNGRRCREVSMKVGRFSALILFLLLSLMPAYAAQAGALPQGVERITSVEGITEYRLQNGLRVLFFPDPSKPTATVNIT